MLKGKLSVRDICEIGIFTAIISVLAQISIPMPLGVPLTLQTFGILLAGMLLGSKKGFLAALVYVLLGAFGVPVFAEFSGGPAIIVGYTGGFILSFPLMAWIVGVGAEKKWFKGMSVIGMAVGIIVNYICGIIVFCIVTGYAPETAFAACVVPFIPGDVIKAVVVWALGVRIRARGVLHA